MPIRLLLLGTVIFGGCDSSRGSTQQPAITIAGSDTEVCLAQRFAEVFSGEGTATVSVRGGGSGTGIAALLDGRIDIATSSRPLKQEERKRATAAGIELVERTVALDALAVIVHRDNPLEAIALETLAALYRGELKRWTSLNGFEEPVVLYGRQSNSGTYDYFRSSVLRGDYSLHMLNMNGNAQIVEGVRNDRNGIGYVGIGYVESLDAPVKILAIDHAGRRVRPTDDGAVRAGHYPISRPLFMFTTSSALPRVQPFFELVEGDAGRAAIRAEGFLPPRGQE